MAIKARTELAWAAGFFDGEGSTLTRGRGPLKGGHWCEMWLTVSQSNNPETLYRFQKAVGGIGKVGGPWKYRENMLPLYRFDVRGIGVVAVIDILWPYLSSPKRLQAKKAFENYEAYLKIRGQRAPGRAKLSVKQVNDLRSQYYAIKADRLKLGHQRMPRGWIDEQASILGVRYHTVKHILCGHGY
jgi:hypothetical protein